MEKFEGKLSLIGFWPWPPSRADQNNLFVIFDCGEEGGKEKTEMRYPLTISDADLSIFSWGRCCIDEGTHTM